MKLLFVPNHAVLERGGRRLVNQHTGRFLVELATSVERLVVAQPLVDMLEGDGLSDFDLVAYPQLHSAARSWRLDSAGSRIASYLQAIPWIVRQVRQADFVYLFLPGRLPMLFAIAAWLWGRPYAAYVRGELEGRGIRFVLGRAAFVIAANEGLRDVARRFCADTSLIRPMMDLRAEDVIERQEQRRAAPWRLLFVGRVERRKGVDDLLEAAPLLARGGLDFRLDVVGGAPASAMQDGGELSRLQRKAAELGISDRVTFHGMVSEAARLSQFYRQADLFVFPTHWEGFARVLYEAMANGLPVLTTFVGGIPSVIRDGENGVRIEVQDPGDIAAKVSAVLADPELRERLAAGGTRTVRRVLGPERRPHAELLAEKLRERWGLP